MMIMGLKRHVRLAILVNKVTNLDNSIININIPKLLLFRYLYFLSNLIWSQGRFGLCGLIEHAACNQSDQREMKLTEMIDLLKQDIPRTVGKLNNLQKRYHYLDLYSPKTQEAVWGRRLVYDDDDDTLIEDI